MNSRAKWYDTFRFAIEGIANSWRTQRNLKIHTFVAVVVIAAALYFDLPAKELALLLLSIALVIGMELMNTALEAVVDLVTPEWHPLAKTAKDAAAGAVLLTAGFAVWIGILLFYEPVVAWLRSMV